MASTAPMRCCWRRDIGCSFALRASGRALPHTRSSYPRECGVSSTPQLFDSTINVSGILDRPTEPVIGRRAAPTRWRAMTIGERCAIFKSSLRAKRSNPSSSKVSVDCFVATLLAMTSSRNPAARCARVFHLVSPSKGRGECRAPNVPAASRVKLKITHELVTTGPPELPGTPARDGFNSFLHALPGEPRSFATVVSGLSPPT
jgi:hypothetical protein